MKCLSGCYWLPLYQYTCQEPDNFSLFLPDASIEISTQKHVFNFCIKSDTADDDEFQNLVYASEDSIGFFLDIPLGTSYSPPPQICDEDSPLTKRSNEIISFRFLQVSLKIDSTEMEIPLNKDIDCSKLEKFISSLRHNELLWHATSYYLKAIQEPEFFLMLLYKAYDIIKEYLGKEEMKRFENLANNSSISGSRHAPEKKHQKLLHLRSLTSNEKNFCQSTIKNGILRYANSFN